MLSSQQQRSSTDPHSMDRNLLDYRDYRASSSWSDLLDEEARDKKPWKKVALAVFLCLAGAIMLTTGICLWYQAPGQGIGALFQPLLLFVLALKHCSSRP